MKSLAIKKALGYTLGITGELTFFYGLLAHGSTVGVVCELVGLSLMIVATYKIVTLLNEVK